MAGEMARGSSAGCPYRAFSSSTYVVAHNCLQLQSQIRHHLLASESIYMQYGVHISRQTHTHTRNENINKLKKKTHCKCTHRTMSPLVRPGHFQELLLNYWCLNSVPVTYPLDSDTHCTRCHAEEKEHHTVTPTPGKVESSSLECGKLGGTP